MTPFEILGLPATADLSDDEVRSAWRRLAAATHPDRPDGGDPAGFAAAAAAYTLLRTLAGRREAVAALRDPRADTGPARRVPARTSGGLALRAFTGRIRTGRPARLAMRLLAAAAVSLLAVLGAGWQPASIAVMAGSLTWLMRASRGDLGR